MKYVWKDFLYFSTREKIACISLLIILAIFIIVYVFCSDLMQVSPKSVAEQETIRKEFQEYEASLESKQVVSNNSSFRFIDDEVDISEIEGLSKSNKSRSKTNSKLSENQTIDINVADENLFQRVPGIGKATAKKIIEYRQLLGGYSDLQQLQEIQGISANKLTALLPYLTLNKKLKVIFFYRSDLQQLLNHPYITTDQLKLLTELKKSKAISSIDDLSGYYQFKQSDIDRLRPYIDFTK